MVVFLGVDNEIVTRPPGYNSAHQWWQLQSHRLQKSTGNTFTTWVHTWNAADSGSAVTFSFSPAPTMNVGDKDLSSANAVAVAFVLRAQTAWLETTTQGLQQKQTTIQVPNLKKDADLVLTGGYAPGVSSFSSNDTFATQSGVTVTATNPAGFGQTITVITRPSPLAGYSPQLTYGLRQDLVSNVVSLSDTTSGYKYQTPFLEEGPVAENRLMYRYRLNRHYTVLNNAGAFSAVRYQSTDQIAAATQVFTNDQTVTQTDRTNILASGVGGEFRAFR